MAGLFGQSTRGCCRLLDPGAGIGTLTAAFLERWACGGFDFQRVEADAFEIDECLHPFLSQTLEAYKPRLNVVSAIRGGDFVAAATGSIRGDLFAKAPQIHARHFEPPL